MINLSLLLLRVLPYGNGEAVRAFVVKSPDDTTGIDISLDGRKLYICNTIGFVAVWQL